MMSSFETDKPKVAMVNGKMIDLQLYKELRNCSFGHEEALKGAEVQLVQIEDFK